MNDNRPVAHGAFPRSLISRRVCRIPESSTVAVADLASALRRRGERVIDFSAGRAAESTHALICDAAKAALDAGHTHQTPARGIPAYLEACAAKLRRDNGIVAEAASEIVATTGCKEGLLLALAAVLDPGDEVIVEDPCFVSYRPQIELCGGSAVAVPLRPGNDFRWTREDLRAAVTERTKAVLICSPHNPLGVVHTRDDLNIVRDVALENDLIVLADEIYDAAVWNGGRHLPIATLPGMRERTVGLMGMTKSFSMGGWRIGYAYSDARIVSKMVVVQQHIMTCASSIAQYAGVAALSDAGVAAMAPVWADWEKRCMHVADGINRIGGLTTRRPEGAFYVWVDIGATGQSSFAFARDLLEREKVAVIPGGSFGAQCDGYVRITCVRSWGEITDGLGRLTRYMEECRS